MFVTAYDEYAVRAFEVHAIDYLLKPFDDARLFTALARAKQRLARHGAAANEPLLALLDEREREPARGALPRARARQGGRGAHADDIDWIEAADYYATLHVGGDAHLLRQTMADLEASLDARALRARAPRRRS